MLFHTNLKEIPANFAVMESNIRRGGGDGRFFLFGVFSRELYETGSLEPRIAVPFRNFMVVSRAASGIKEAISVRPFIRPDQFPRTANRGASAFLDSLSNTFDGRQIGLVPSRNSLTHKPHGRHDC